MKPFVIFQDLSYLKLSHVTQRKVRVKRGLKAYTTDIIYSQSVYIRANIHLNSDGELTLDKYHISVSNIIPFGKLCKFYGRYLNKG